MLPDKETPEVSDTQTQPSKTIRLDFENLCFGEEIDEKEALAQAIFLILLTRRYEYPVFSHDYGTDYENVMQGDYMMTVSAIKDAVTDAVLTDDRVTSLENFAFERSGHAILASFTAKSIFGDIEITKEIT